ncbi:MAG: hypothetical protein ACYSRR_04040 [Planctomycetota bacterium]|jgi:hypothetical protein
MTSAKLTVFSLILAIIWATTASALTYTGDIEATVGSGTNSATIAVDFDLDNSFLFIFSWDGAATGADALMAIEAATDLTAITAFGGSFVVDLIYPSGIKHDYGDPNPGWAYYTSQDGENWDYSMVGYGDRVLSDNCWDSWTWTNYSPDWFAYRTPGAAPTPEPCTIALLALGALLTRRRIA